MNRPADRRDDTTGRRLRVCSVFLELFLFRLTECIELLRLLRLVRLLQLRPCHARPHVLHRQMPCSVYRPLSQPTLNYKLYYVVVSITYSIPWIPWYFDVVNCHT